METQPPIRGLIPLVQSGDARWEHLPFFKTWLIWIGVSTLITTGLLMISAATLDLSGLEGDEDGDPSYVVQLVSTGVCLVITFGVSFLTYRWSLQRFLLPKL